TPLTSFPTRRSSDLAIVDEDLVDRPVEEVASLTARSPDFDAVRADRRRRSGDGKLLDAIQVSFHSRPIERRREMIPNPRRDAPREEDHAAQLQSRGQ